MTIAAPKFLTPTYLHQFLKQCEYVFQKGRKNERGFLIDFSSVKKTSMLSVLVTYKILEYSFINRRFLEPRLIVDDIGDIRANWRKYGFEDLILNYMESGGVGNEDYRKLKIVFEDKFFLAPQALLRGDQYSTVALKEKVLPKIESYYGKNESAVAMIFTCLSEIILNFWEHAVEDTKSIVVAYGNKSHIEIACADTGNGIISSLKPVLAPELKHEQIMLKSVEKGVTSKKNSDHMGYGLWILSQITGLVKGRMHLYSEGFMYQNEAGSVTIRETGFWPGTIIYLALPVLKPVTVKDIPEYKDPNKFTNLKIDFR